VLYLGPSTTGSGLRMPREKYERSVDRIWADERIPRFPLRELDGSGGCSSSPLLETSRSTPSRWLEVQKREGAKTLRLRCKHSAYLSSGWGGWFCFMLLLRGRGGGGQGRAESGPDRRTAFHEVLYGRGLADALKRAAFVLITPQAAEFGISSARRVGQGTAQARGKIINPALYSEHFFPVVWRGHFAFSQVKQEKGHIRWKTLFG